MLRQTKRLSEKSRFFSDSPKWEKKLETTRKWRSISHKSMNIARYVGEEKEAVYFLDSLFV